MQQKGRAGNLHNHFFQYMEREKSRIDEDHSVFHVDSQDNHSGLKLILMIIIDYAL